MEGGDGEFANFTLPTLKAFLEACIHSVSGNKQELIARAIGCPKTHFFTNSRSSGQPKNDAKTGPRSAVVSASDCGSEGLGFESHQSHVGFFGPGRLLPRAGSAMGPVGRLEPHSRASSTKRMRL